MKSPRRVPLFFACLFYGFLGAAGVIWLEYGCPRRTAALLEAENPGAEIAMGAAAGVAMAGVWALVRRWSPRARSLESEFGWLLGDHRPAEMAILALLSGMAEEVLFRGALQQSVGYPFATLIFALAHPPFNSRVSAWPVFAGAAGAVLGALAEWTGRLVAPIAAHAVLNLTNLLFFISRYRVAALTQPRSAEAGRS